MIGTVNIYNGNGFGRMRSLLPFGAASSRGLFVAVGDVNGDGLRDVIASSEGGWLPAVAVVSGASVFAAAPPRPRFLAFPNAHRVGVRVAVKPTGGGNPGFVEAVDLILSGGPGGGAVSRRVRQARFGVALTPVLTPVLTDRVFAGAAFNGLYVG